MIPKFPKFKRLALTDKTSISHITRLHEPYSDFNFQSLWSYNIHNNVKISLLYENLVIILESYIYEQPVISFIGRSKLEDTIDKLIKWAEKNNLERVLRLVPESVVAERPLLTHYSIIEDPDNHDYIISLEDFKDLRGAKYRSKRKNVEKFLLNYPLSTVRHLQLGRKSIQKTILGLFDDWVLDNNLSIENTRHERESLRRFLRDYRYLDGRGLGIWHHKKLLGFYLYAIDNQEYAHNYYMKTRRNHRGLYETMDHVAAHFLYNRGCRNLNIQQDLGRSKLRLSKQLCRPSKYLKKYIILPRAESLQIKSR